MTIAEALIKHIAEGPQAWDGAAMRNGGEPQPERTPQGGYVYLFGSQGGAKAFATHMKSTYGLNVVGPVRNPKGFMVSVRHGGESVAEASIPSSLPKAGRITAIAKQFGATDVEYWKSAGGHNVRATFTNHTDADDFWTHIEPDVQFDWDLDAPSSHAGGVYVVNLRRGN